MNSRIKLTERISIGFIAQSNYSEPQNNAQKLYGVV